MSSTEFSPPLYRRSLWLEASDFDTREGDFGVAAYLDLLGFIPHAVSFLTSSPDFVLLHDCCQEDSPSPADFCSYGGRWHADPERPGRPPWTRRRLKQLVALFQQRGVAVYFAVFDQVLESRFHPEWAMEHPEVLARLRTGQRLNSINPLACLSDGTFYEDFFNRQLAKVLHEYGFNGFHCADGCNHLRFPLYWSDYSDGMVDQFAEGTPLALPGELSGSLNALPELFEQRAEWIWKEKRLEWISFYQERWTRHIKKLADTVHTAGGRLLFNTTWTRDPFEAIYRWGIDYRKLAVAGVDEFILECPGAGNELGSEGGNVYRDFYYKILANLLLTKAALPTAKITALHHTHDLHENYEVLRHAPSFLEKEAYTYPNLFYKSEAGELTRCLDGWMVCLASGIRRDEWEIIREHWDKSAFGQPLAVSGVTLVSSQATLPYEMRDVMVNRGPSTHALLSQLLAHGAPIHSIADIGSLAKLSGPLLLLNSHHYSTDELRLVAGYRGGAVILIGASLPLTGTEAWSLIDPEVPGGFQAVLLEDGLLQPERASSGAESAVALEVEEPRYYCHDLPCRHISNAFIESCASLMNRAAGAFVQSNDHSTQVFSVQLEPGSERLFIRNNEWAYTDRWIELPFDIAALNTVTRFPYRPITREGRRIHVRIPPKGVVCVDLLPTSAGKV